MSHLPSIQWHLHQISNWVRLRILMVVPRVDLMVDRRVDLRADKRADQMVDQRVDQMVGRKVH